MDDRGKLGEPSLGLDQTPVLVIIERHTLMRTCLLNILKSELTGFEIVEMTTTKDLDRVAGRDVRLIALDIGDKPIVDPVIEDDLTAIKGAFPDTPVTLLSNHDDEASASAAVQKGVRGFIPTSLPVQVAIAGLRLVLAGSVYRPLPIDATLTVRTGSFGQPGAHEAKLLRKVEFQEITIDLTPREMEVLAALELGYSNKLIAAKLSLSENTVKMHMQHIMRKCCARNRTQAVLLCSGRLSGTNHS
jgi:DNA-binding NarL/FixJ family response regulator